MLRGSASSVIRSSIAVYVVTAFSTMATRLGAE